MLVLTVREDGRIFIGDGIEVVVVATSRGKVRLGIKAPASVGIRRGELDRRTESSNDSERAA